MSISELRKELAASFRLAWRFGLSEGVNNHFSAAVEGPEERYLINRFGPLWSEINEDDLLLIDGHGVVLEGEGDVEATARYIHIAGHRANSRHKVLLHTHMPHATAFTMLEDGELIMAHQNALQFWRRMAWHDYGGLALGADEGERISQGQRKNPDADILFLRAHGVIVGGETIHEAFHDLYFLERACRQQLLAMQAGKPLRALPENLVSHTNEQILNVRECEARLFFDALMRTERTNAANWSL